jgi:hypothetical protein
MRLPKLNDCSIKAERIARSVSDTEISERFLNMAKAIAVRRMC